ncbi:beta-glucosidase [Ideonella sp. 4Y16]|uniref:Beta-glucosidase n=1 Tax=Ideonella alba TaxID=2824118 RepID=A0A940Y4Z7_9BURK|nr:GH1 family beta-glucosidase [Ideonella alba]MBQ0929887.1 beta-glucosidase [Ideonella alba]MBQ0942120.1 beta-glucosidase [Ideonella alba]
MNAHADPLRFPPGFVWGAATAAYQVEGSPLADGAGPSIWHRFSHTPGRVRDGDTGDVACDHYRRYPEDIALMRSLGLQSYRFSIAWSRVLPEGRGRINQAGLDHYARVVDALLEAGIAPNITLYHWDLPAALDDRGGWLNPDIADWFADYATLMFRTLGDRVPLWSTLNEPWVVADGGYMHGVLAPGHRSAFEAAIAAHHLLLAHGRGVQAFRASGARGQIGLVVNLEPKYPASHSPADLAATLRAEAYMNRQYLDPVLRGTHAEELAEVFGEAWPAPRPAEQMAVIREPIDWLGVNYYTRSVVRADESAWPQRASAVPQRGALHTETAWEVYPRGLTDTLTWVKNRYGNLPIYITENGSAFFDPPSAEVDPLPDPLRTQTLHKHLAAVHAAIGAGVDVRGYYAWSLLDNLEWAHGYSKRFGLLHVDYATQRRTRKASALAYAAVIAANAL